MGSGATAAIGAFDYLIDNQNIRVSNSFTIIIINIKEVRKSFQPFMFLVNRQFEIINHPLDERDLTNSCFSINGIR